MAFSKQDHEFMARAINLAKKGRFTTTPNPNVGCVVVKDEEIIGEGWHQKAGTGHAEVNALANVDSGLSHQSTAYVTLEPCSHVGRTPPCAKRLIEAGVCRVVIAMLDPNPRVAGNGVRLLKEAGIGVEVGLLASEARALNPGFLTRMEQQRPFVQVKLAASIDGKTALENGDSKWITSAEARADVQKHRAESCAIISTAQTVLADNAKLNVRQEQLPLKYPKTDVIDQIRQPIKIILDGRGQLTRQHVSSLGLFQQEARVVLVRTESTDEFRDFPWVETLALPHIRHSGFDLEQVLNWCYRRELGLVWVEAGATLAASFIEQNLYDELIVYLAPKILGRNGREMLPIGPLTNMSQVLELTTLESRQVGDDIKLTFGKANK